MNKPLALIVPSLLMAAAAQADIPASGTSTKGLKSPAVLLDVVPDQTAQ